MTKMSKVSKGAAMIEFAIILPVLMLILLGTVHYGLFIYDQAVITNAAREGARWGAIHSTASASADCSSSVNPGDLSDPDPCLVANNYAYKNVISLFAEPVITSESVGTGVSGSLVTVTVSFWFTGMGYANLFKSESLHAKSIMYHE